jgi:dual specificity tyrosine-phosphorylation-regulated kinase 2/3/4
MCALKVIKNKKRFHQQAEVEVKILRQLAKNDPDVQSNVVHMIDSFVFRSHLCITFDLHSINLYEFLKRNHFKGLSGALVRRFAAQLLVSLSFLRRNGVVHCDLKPENILLASPSRSQLKLIDFGSSCFVTEQSFTYIQSRFYRSPEVILGHPYDTQIDMWSLGCILAELHAGYPLFPGEDETELMACIMECLGVPPAAFVESSPRKKNFFDTRGAPRTVANSRGRKRTPGSTTLASALKTTDVSFVSFLEGCLEWDPAHRMTPEQALQHPWITGRPAPLYSYKSSVSPFRVPKTSSDLRYRASYLLGML